MGRSATGVKAITLDDGDWVVSSDVMEEGDRLLNVTENGYGKRTAEDAFNVQRRGGKGVKIHQITEKTGALFRSHKGRRHGGAYDRHIRGRYNKAQRKGHFYLRKNIPGRQAHQS